MSFFPSFKKYKHDYAIVLGVVVIGLIAVLGQQFADTAKSKFWWIFWDIATVVCIVAWIAGWLFLKAKDSRATARENEELQNRK